MPAHWGRWHLGTRWWWHRGGTGAPPWKRGPCPAVTQQRDGEGGQCSAPFAPKGFSLCVFLPGLAQRTPGRHRGVSWEGCAGNSLPGAGGGHWGSHCGHPEGMTGGQGRDGTGAGKQEHYCNGDLRRAEQNAVSLGVPPALGVTGLHQGAAVPGARCPAGETGTTNSPGDTGVQQHHHSPRVPPALSQHEEGPCGPRNLCLWGFTACGRPCVPHRVSPEPRGVPSAVPTGYPRCCPPRVPPALSPGGVPSSVPPA